MDHSMRRSVKQVSRVALLAAAGALAACSTSSIPDFTQVKLPSPRTVMPRNVDTYVPPVSVRALKPVGPADLVDAQGVCAAMAPAAAAAADQGSETGAPVAPPMTGPAVPGPVGLEMTECEVVAAVGPPRSVNIASNERGDRKVTMIFMGNERAGTYEFVGGRLTSLERGPEPPAPPPQPKKKPATAKKRPPSAT